MKKIKKKISEVDENKIQQQTQWLYSHRKNNLVRA